MRKISIANMAKIELATAFVIWGTVGVFVKYIPLNSGLVALDRSFVGLMFLVIAKLCTKSKFDFSAIKENFLVLCINGALLGFNWILLFESYNFTSVAISTICYNIGPIFVMLFSPIVFREKLSVVKLICVFSALFGIVCVSGVFQQSKVSYKDLFGILLGLLAASLYAVTVMINKKIEKVNPADKAITQFASSTIVMLIYSLFVTQKEELVFSFSTVLLLIVVGVLHTGVAYTVYFKSLKHVTSQSVAVFAYIDPVVAVILSALVLKEELSFFVITGAIIIIVSALVGELYDNKQKK